MSKASSAQKKEMILASARKVFYEQGYTDAYLEHIAADCGLSKQLLLYYFPSKSALASGVFDQIGLEIKQLIEKRMHDYFGGMEDLQVCTAVEIKLSALLYLRDEKAMRFQRETMFLASDPGYINMDMSFYDMHVRKYDLQLDAGMDELKMISHIVDAAGAVLLSNYSLGIYNCSEEKFLDYNVAIMYHLMKLPQERIDEINRMSNAILELLNFRFKPYFVVE